MIKIPLGKIQVIEADFASLIPFQYDASLVTWSASGSVVPSLNPFGGQVNIFAGTVGSCDLTVSYATTPILTQTVEFYDPTLSSSWYIKVVQEDGSELLGDLYVPNVSTSGAPTRTLLVYTADQGGNPVMSSAFVISSFVSGSGFTLTPTSGSSAGIGLLASGTALGTLTLTGSGGLTRNVNLIAYNPSLTAVPNLSASFKAL